MPEREPDLSRKLAHTIKPTGDPAAQLDTLADAAQLIADLEPFRQARPMWDRAAEMILLAARTGRKADVAESYPFRRSGAVARELAEGLG